MTKHQSKANWSKLELNTIWGHLKRSEGGGPRAQTRALHKMAAIRSASPSTRQKMRGVLQLGGKLL